MVPMYAMIGARGSGQLVIMPCSSVDLGRHTLVRRGSLSQG